VTPTSTRITPAYEIKDGGRHGTLFGSDRTIEIKRSSYTEATIDAGRPEGVPQGTEISSCEPQIQGMDIVDTLDGSVDDDVTVNSKGLLS